MTDNALSHEGDSRRVHLDRRTFLQITGVVAAMSAAALALPCSAIARLAAEVATPETDADWRIDDMWGHSPRYAQPIPYGRGHIIDCSIALTDPLNHLFPT